MSDEIFSPFIDWFNSQHGYVDTSSMGLTIFPSYGRGVVALHDIPEGHTLCTIPRELTLSVRTSPLPAHFGMKEWSDFKLNDGWAGLILCMMWENAHGPSSKWSGYISSLPTSFDTPMFWSEEDLAELKGTSILEKIGKDEAERDYREKLVLAVNSRPDLFPSELLAQYYSLDHYHIIGSCILSRSFQVEKWKDEDGAADASADNDMDVDADAHPLSTNDDGDESGDNEAGIDIDDADADDDDEDYDDPTNVAMVPMADMFNAKYESENVKLFYEEHNLKMITTKPIKAGEQIMNTYGDPPNSDLLRRYGHVDLVPLRSPQSGEGNPEDVVEIPADLVVKTAINTTADNLQERIDWWLELADDDTFVLHADMEVPEELVSLTRLLLLPNDEWEKCRLKNKLPKVKIDTPTLSIILNVLEARLRGYPTTIEMDELLLAHDNVSTLSLNKKHAVIVRLGEKRILQHVLQGVKRGLALLESGMKGKKRGRDEQNGKAERGKKAKR